MLFECSPLSNNQGTFINIPIKQNIESILQRFFNREIGIQSYHSDGHTKHLKNNPNIYEYMFLIMKSCSLKKKIYIILLTYNLKKNVLHENKCDFLLPLSPVQRESLNTKGPDEKKSFKKMFKFIYIITDT